MSDVDDHVEALARAKDHATFWFVRFGDALNKLADAERELALAKGRMRIHERRREQVSREEIVQVLRDSFSEMDESPFTVADEILALFTRETGN